MKIENDKITFLEGQITFTFDISKEIKNVIQDNNRQITVFLKESNEQESALGNKVPSEDQKEKHFFDSLKNENLKISSYDYTHLPTVEEIKDYLKSKGNYEYDNYEIFMNFFGHFISPSEDKNFYNQIVKLTSQAKFQIANEERGQWNQKGKRLLENGRSVLKYTFTRETEETAQD